jgi:hypothetical protein
MPPDEIRTALGIPRLIPSMEASAKYGQGVFDTLKRIVTECMKLVGDPRRAAEGRTPSILPGKRASMYPEALARPARSGPPPRREPEPEIPRAPKVPNLGTRRR